MSKAFSQSDGLTLPHTQYSSGTSAPSSYPPPSQVGGMQVTQYPSAVYDSGDRNRLTRTPSPTSSEIEELNSTGLMNLAQLKKPTPKNIG